MDVVNPKPNRDGWLLATKQLSGLVPPTIKGTPTAAGRYVSKTEMTTVATAKAMIATVKTTIAT